MLGGATRRGAAGGLDGPLEQLQCSGFGEQANSWVSRGPNQPISPGAMAQIFGQDGLEQISRQAGSATRGIAGPLQLLPEVVDRMTPGLRGARRRRAREQCRRLCQAPRPLVNRERCRERERERERENEGRCRLRLPRDGCRQSDRDSKMLERVDCQRVI